MPCVDGGPSYNDIKQKRVASLLLYLNQKEGRTGGTDEDTLRRLADSGWRSRADIDSTTAELCARLRALDPVDLERIAYNARDPVSRDLADWWEHHQKEDLERQQREDAEKAREKLRSTAAAKLTAEERKALGLDP